MEVCLGNTAWHLVGVSCCGLAWAKKSGGGIPDELVSPCSGDCKPHASHHARCGVLHVYQWEELGSCPHASLQLHAQLLVERGVNCDGMDFRNWCPLWQAMVSPICEEVRYLALVSFRGNHDCCIYCKTLGHIYPYIELDCLKKNRLSKQCCSYKRMGLEQMSA